MKNQISHCPFCGEDFKQTAEETDPRSASGYKCDNCDEMLEISVNRFPLAH